MIKKVFIFIISIIITAACVFIAHETVRTFAGADKAESGSPSAPSAAPKYRLGEWKGKVAAFNADEDTPYEIFDVYVDSLPDIDRVLLKKGIPAADREALDALIEDYTS